MTQKGDSEGQLLVLNDLIFLRLVTKMDNALRLSVPILAIYEKSSQESLIDKLPNHFKSKPGKDSGKKKKD